MRLQELTQNHCPTRYPALYVIETDAHRLWGWHTHAAAVNWAARNLSVTAHNIVEVVSP